MKLRIHAAAVIALAITAAGSLTAKAATVTNYQDGDIFLGIRALSTDTGQGNTTVYLINLGNYSQFTNATAGSTFEVANLFSDLNTIYGTDNWYSRAGLQFGVFGGTADGDTSRTLYASRQSTTPWGQLNFTAGNTAYNLINQVRNSYNGNQATAGNADAITQATSLSTGYYAQVNKSSDFDKWSGGIEARLNTSLNLFALPTGQATELVGSFSISNQGVVSFTAVPEPSTFLLIGVAGLTLVVFRRRLQKVQA